MLVLRITLYTEMTLPHSPFIKTLSGVFTAYHDVEGCSPLIMPGERLTAWCANETHNTSALTCKAALGSATLHLQAQPQVSPTRRLGAATTNTWLRCQENLASLRRRHASEKDTLNVSQPSKVLKTCLQPSKSLETCSQHEGLQNVFTALEGSQDEFTPLEGDM